MSDGRTHYQISRWLILLSATFLFLAVLFLLPEGIGWPARSTIAIMVYALVLWAFAPIPIGLTALFVLALLLLMRPVDIGTVFSGFASPAIFLIIGGM